jgi:hypothetical protein
MTPQTVVRVTSEAGVPIWFASATNAGVITTNLRTILQDKTSTSSTCIAMLLQTSPTWPLSEATNGLPVVHLHFRERKLYVDGILATP